MPSVIPVMASILGAVLLDPNAIGQAVRRDGKLSDFMGRAVTIAEPECDPDGFFPKGPASVCLEAPPQRQCYTAPEHFGRIPSVTTVQLDKSTPAILFSAASGGVSGWGIHFALLRPGTGKDLENLFMSDTSVSNQSQHAFWREPAISDAQIFVTADFIWGPDESHYSEHRYMISAYVRKPSSLLDGSYFFYLEDRYMTVRKYDLEGNADVLSSERQEILARLRRLKVNAESQQRGPR
jgi:hypothetical protein